MILRTHLLVSAALLAAGCSPSAPDASTPDASDASTDGSLDTDGAVDGSIFDGSPDTSLDASVDAAPETGPVDAGTVQCTYWTRTNCTTQSAPTTETVKISYWPPQNAPLDTTGSIAVSSSKGLETLSAASSKQWFLYPTDNSRKEYVGPVLDGVCGDAVLGAGTLTVTFSKAACQRQAVGCQPGSVPYIQVECTGVIGWP